jgi:hypothetical protein
MPHRIQLSRAKGWRMPADTLKIDRTTRWGNPFKVGTSGVPDAATAVARFRDLVARLDVDADPKLAHFAPDSVRAALQGSNLACWCPLGSPCHGDVLLELANR